MRTAKTTQDWSIRKFSEAYFSGNIGCACGKEGVSNSCNGKENQFWESTNEISKFSLSELIGLYFNFSQIDVVDVSSKVNSLNDLSQILFCKYG